MSEDNKPRVIEFYKYKSVWSILLFSVFGILLHFFPLRCDFQLPHSSNSQPAYSTSLSYNSLREAPKPEQQIIRVEVDSEKWSEWVRIPDGCTFKINRPGCWIEFWYWDNTKRRYEDNGLPQWIGTIRSSIFKLRGTKGPVEILIEPR